MIRRDQWSRASILWICFSIVLVLLVESAFAILFLGIRYSKYILVNDEPAFIHGSLGSPSNWFAHGFSAYFTVYPEWVNPYTNFLRPVANLSAKILDLIFRNHFGLYYTAYYSAFFILAILVIKVSRVVNLRGWQYLAIGAILSINPAFVSLGMLEIPFFYDIVCAMFCLGALHSLLYKQYVQTFILLTLAVFTKESALYAPLAAALSVILFHKKTPRSVSVLMLVPLALWAFARVSAFGSLTGGTYAHFGGISMLKGALIWPLGTVDVTSVTGAIRSGHVTGTAVVEAAEFVGNIFVWLTLIIIALPYATSALAGVNRDEWRSDEEIAKGQLVLWLLGGLAYVIFIGAYSARFGGSVAPLLILVLLMVSSGAGVLRRMAQISVVIVALAYAGHLVTFLRVDVPEYMVGVNMQRSLYAALASLPQDGHDVLVFDAPNTFSSPRAIQEALHLKDKVIFVDQFRGCAEGKVSHSSSGGRALASDDSGFILSIPDCAEFRFNGTKLDQVLGGGSKSIARGGVGLYRFGKFRFVRTTFSGKRMYDFGKELLFLPEIKVAHYVGYNFRSGTYYVVNPG